MRSDNARGNFQHVDSRDGKPDHHEYQDFYDLARETHAQIGRESEYNKSCRRTQRELLIECGHFHQVPTLIQSHIRAAAP